MFAPIQLSSTDFLSEEELVKNKLTLIENTNWEDSDLINFCLQFGRLLKWPFGYINELKFDKSAKNYLYSGQEVPFHWDGAFFKEPRFIIFYCQASNEVGGETLFTDSEQIIASLSSSERLKANSISVTYHTKKIAHYGGDIKQSIINYHPYNKKEILRVAEPVDTALNPVSVYLEENDKPIYQKIISDLRKPQYCYSHQWQTGDLIIADNFSLLHGRNALGVNTKRVIKRVHVL